MCSSKLINFKTGSPIPKPSQYYHDSSSHKLNDTDKLQNNSISSSVSSSSSATNSSAGNFDPPHSDKLYEKKRLGSPSFTSQKSLNRRSSVSSHYMNQPNILRDKKRDNVLSEKNISNQLKKQPLNFNFSSLNKKSHNNTDVDGYKSTSYTFNTYNPNRLSSYDNNDLFQEYLSSCNNSEIKPDYHNSQNIIITDHNEKAKNDLNEQHSVLSAYAKRASYGQHQMPIQRDSFRKGIF